MDRLYRGLAALAGAAAVPILRLRGAAGDADALERLALAGPGGREGAGGPDGAGRPVWCHAASVGEIQALLPVVEEIRRRHGGLSLVISTMTVTGRAVARDRAAWARPFLFPLDVPSVARRAFRRIEPRGMLIAETEIWPAVIHAARAAGTPLALVNGRMSERGFRRYRLIAPVVRDAFHAFRLFALQSEADRERFLALGAPADRVHVSGNTKVDVTVAAPDDAARARERSHRGIGDADPLLVAGSARPEEFAPILDGFLLARGGEPHLRLLLAPRHPDRVPAAEEAVRARGLRAVRWSAPAAPAAPAGDPAAWDVLLLDTLGELASAYALGEIAFVGGTLDARYGGHNPLEPAAHGVPVLFGPHRRNAAAASDALVAAGAALEVTDARSLAAAIGAWLGDERARSRAGEAGRGVVRELQGAAVRTVDLLEAEGFPW